MVRAAIALGAGAVWVADSLDDGVVRIDPSTRAVTTTIPVGRNPVGVAVGEGSVWVANSGDGTVTRIDPQGGKRETIPVGGSPQSVVVADGRVWVTVDRQTIANTSAASSGGTLRLSSQGDVGPMDPAFCVSLVAAPRRHLREAPQLPGQARPGRLPARARGRPVATDTVAGRQDLHVHDPEGFPLLAALQGTGHRPDVQERDRAEPQPHHEGPGAGADYLGDVVGAKAYMSGKAAHISGIVVRGNTLTVHLLSPVPDLPSRLAMPFFCAVPLGTPLDPKGVSASPPPAPTTWPRTRPGRASCWSATRTTPAAAPITPTGSN